jgi:C-terminal processing protease CtpA/Prc
MPSMNRSSLPSNSDEDGFLAQALCNLRARPISDLEVISSKAQSLSTAERQLIVDQAIILLDRLYVHLAMKRVRHAIDPIRALRLLREQAASLTDLVFHTQMLRIFRSLHDIHTAYTAPPPYSQFIAFLPFLMEPCQDAQGQTRYLLTRVIEGFDHPSFREGSEIVSWHGAPVNRAVERYAMNEVGANPDSRLALGNEFMTVRWLGSCLLPDEDWVILGYRSQEGSMEEIRLPWSLLDLGDQQVTYAIQSVWIIEEHTKPPDLDLALDFRSHTEHVTRRLLFAPAVKRCRKQLQTSASSMASGQEGTQPLETKLPHLFSAETISHSASGTPSLYGYLRIRAFQHDKEDDFVQEFRRLLTLMPRSGLVLDLRGNPGGVVQCAERILQLLTPKRITPLLFRFLGSDLTNRLCEPLDKAKFPLQQTFPASIRRKIFAKNWGKSIDIARSTGAQFSGGVPLTSVDQANDVGQEYFGPVVLIIDAVTYSAGDIFAAGFQDHGIGKVLGVDSSTGGGGANVWSHQDVQKLLPDEPDIMPLPGGCQIRVAARNCERTGAFSGMPIEELGVAADVLYSLSERDVLEDNPDLKSFAIAQLSDQPSYWLELDWSVTEAGQLAIKSSGIDRLDIYLDQRPLGSFDASSDTPLNKDLHKERSFSTVEVRGFKDNQLVACRRVARQTNPS